MNRNPEYVSFNKAIGLISDGKYDEALVILQSKVKESKVIAETLNILNSDKLLSKNPDRLAVILTYTWGANVIKNQTTDVSTLSYKNARSESVKRAEK